MKSAGAAVLMLLCSALAALAAESGRVRREAPASCLSEVRRVQREMLALVEEQRAEVQQAKAQLDQQLEKLKKDTEGERILNA